MTREELLTAARHAKAWRRDVAGEGDWPWLTEDELANDYGLPEPDALFISLASPDTVLEMQAEIDELREALKRLVRVHDLVNAPQHERPGPREIERQKREAWRIARCALASGEDE